MTRRQQPRLMPLEALKPWDRNPRDIEPAELEQLKRLLVDGREMLWARPLVALEDGTVIMGNQRLRAARELGWESIPTLTVDLSRDEARKWALRDNRPAGHWVEPALAQLLGEMQADEVDLDLTGFDEGELARLLATLGEQPAHGPVDRGALADRFVVPPFSVLDQRAGYWKERRKAWLELGIRSELGRPGVGIGNGSLVPGTTGKGMADQLFAGGRGMVLGDYSSTDPFFYRQKAEVEAELGRTLTTAEFQADHYQPREGLTGLSQVGTSIFDPVLCEIAYRWFSPPGGRVLDPFAGGSVRGIVAAELGRSYLGIDLRHEQVLANAAQADEICATAERRAAVGWLTGDSSEVLLDLAELGKRYDLVFTCPPYYDLEQYGDDERDLSAMTSTGFDTAYDVILRSAVALLADDSFAVLVVSDVRGPDGNYRPLADVTTAIMARAGLGLYNRAVLVSPVGSLPVRAARMFTSSRKLGRTHQDVLVYLKGDARRATERCGTVDVSLNEVQVDDEHGLE